jgi:hypothetical protein
LAVTIKIERLVFFLSMIKNKYNKNPKKKRKRNNKCEIEFSLEREKKRL